MTGYKNIPVILKKYHRIYKIIVLLLNFKDRPVNTDTHFDFPFCFCIQNENI